MTVKNNIPCCDEASAASKIGYIPCDAATDGRLYESKRGEGPYHFCRAHLAHNLRRGFTEVTDA